MAELPLGLSRSVDRIQVVWSLQVCVRGPTIFQGYYKDEAQSREAIDNDGWLHTGDIGLWLPGGRLKIIDRKKNIFKLAQVSLASCSCCSSAQCWLGLAPEQAFAAVPGDPQPVLQLKQHDLGAGGTLLSANGMPSPSTPCLQPQC